MKRNTLFNILAAIVLSLVCSCSNDKGNTVNIHGTVSDAKGELLTLMHLSGSNPVTLDTLRLGEDGKFCFKPTVEQGGPDFFCLVLNGQTIPVVSDTLQSPISIIANKDKFGTSYIAEDSLNNALKQAVMVGGNLRRQLYDLTADRQSGKVSNIEFGPAVQKYVAEYKDQVLHDYIFKDPGSPICYYLLFETVSGMTIFDPLDAQDNRAFGAVATLWSTLYPNSPRSVFLQQRAIEGQQLRRQMRENQQLSDSIVQSVLKESTFIDLELIDNQDKIIPLSSINGKGDVVLVDFTAFYYDMSVAHNMELRKVYDRYKDRGLKIYQICMDFDVNFWKVSASNLPWTVVRDRDILINSEDGLLQYSGAAALYNVTSIPTVFVMGRDGAPVARVEDDSKLEAAVSKLF